VAFSRMFWILYLYGGISDLIDGPIARRLKQQSNFGAKLDSIADLAFLMAIFFLIAPSLVIPIWLWICVGAIALTRVISYVIGYIKYHTFSSLHTYANKVTGAFLFGIPFLYMEFGIVVTGIILSILAFISSFEELIITVRATELNRDIKSIFGH
jgi:CDP-diacylglycerol--glycerol-3-phosphate 3-phosphatidyltransferase